MNWHHAPIAAFFGLLAILLSVLIVDVKDRVETATDPVCSTPRPKGPPGSCNDCKDAFKRITYTQD